MTTVLTSCFICYTIIKIIICISKYMLLKQ